MQISNKNCFECGRPADDAHHIIPKSFGGTRTIPLCNDCHGKVHGTNRLKASYLVRLALAKKFNAELYPSIFLSILYEHKSFTKLMEEYDFKRGAMYNLTKNIFLFEWNDLYDIMRPVLQLEENYFYTVEGVKQDWLDFKSEYPNMKSYNIAIKEGVLEHNEFGMLEI